MAKFTTLIVGAHFRPPAKQILAIIPGGARVTLEEDNENAYDSSAVKVFLPLDQIPDSQMAGLAEELPNSGLTLEQLMSSGPVWLGYLPATEGKPLAKAKLTEPELIGNQQVREIMGQGQSDPQGYSCCLGFGTDGSPRLEITTTE